MKASRPVGKVLIQPGSQQVGLHICSVLFNRLLPPNPASTGPARKSAQVGDFWNVRRQDEEV
jgi:hypothetical protein